MRSVIFKDIRAFQEQPHVLVFFESVPSVATKQTLSKRCFPHAQRYFRAHDFSFLLNGSIINFYYQVLFSLPFFLGEAVNLLFRGANSLNNSENNLQKVYCFDAPPSSS